MLNFMAVSRQIHDDGHVASRLRTNHPWPRYPSHHRRACRVCRWIRCESLGSLLWDGHFLTTSLATTAIIQSTPLAKPSNSPRMTNWHDYLWFMLANGARPMLSVAVVSFGPLTQSNLNCDWESSAGWEASKNAPSFFAGTTRLSNMCVSHATHNTS